MSEKEEEEEERDGGDEPDLPLRPAQPSVWRESSRMLQEAATVVLRMGWKAVTDCVEETTWRESVYQCSSLDQQL